MMMRMWSCKKPEQKSSEVEKKEEKITEEEIADAMENLEILYKHGLLTIKPSELLKNKIQLKKPTI